VFNHCFIETALHARPHSDKPCRETGAQKRAESVAQQVFRTREDPLNTLHLLFYLSPIVEMWCLRLFGGSNNKRRSPPPWPKNSPKAQAPSRPPISTKPRNPQKECPLFSPTFPAELRLKIYEAAIGNPDRYMHVIPFDDQSNRVGRRRCDNIHESGGPTFQHSCFGQWLTSDKLYSQRIYEFWSGDRILALVTVCHRMYVCFRVIVINTASNLVHSYLEALDVLYAANLFSLK
jgi:hypothetical protein